MNQAADPLAHAFELSRSGQHEAALSAITTLLRATPADARAHALHGRILALMGKPEQARAAIDGALALDARCAPAWLEQAALARANGDRAGAADAMQRLVEIAPGHVAFWYDLGVLRGELEQLDAAYGALSQALTLAPGHLEARFKRANIDATRGQHQQAAADYAQCLALRPDWLEAQLNAGESSLALNRVQDALRVFRQATLAHPDSPRAWDGLARAAKLVGAHAELLNARRRAAELTNTALAWGLLAHELLRQGLLAAGREAFERGISADPKWLPSRWGRFQNPLDMVHQDDAAMAQFRAQWREGLAWFEDLDLQQAAPEQLDACVTLATEFYVHYLGEPMLDEQRRYGALLQAMMARINAQALQPAPRPRDDGRLRIGFASAFMRGHTITKLFAPLLSALDRSRWEISCFHTADLINEGTARWRDPADFFAHGERDLRRWAQTIRERDLDLLVYPDIGMHSIIQGLASLRLAPVQAMLWGHPTSSGRDTIDWFLTSDAMEVQGAPSCYSEQLLRLPGLGTCYAPPSNLPVAVPELSDRAPDQVHYLIAQQAMKLSPMHDALLARIAGAVPGARLHLVPSPLAPVRESLRARMTKNFAAAGLDLAQHLGVFRFVSEAEFLGLGRDVDINLDSIGWSGGNTSLEILYFDTPTVTLPGELMRSRHTYAMLRLMELDQLIARDIDDYVRIAIELGRSADFRAQMRGLIAQRKHRLYDDHRVGTAFAQFAAQVAQNVRGGFQETTQR